MRSHSVVQTGKPMTAIPFCAALFIGFLSTPAYSQVSGGLVGGTIHDAGDGKPISEVRINAYNAETAMNRATVTDSGGRFQFAGLDPGKYEIAVTKDGFRKASAQVEVVARHTAQVDFVLQKVESVSALTDREKMLLDRLEHLESRLAAIEVKEREPKENAAYRAPQSEGLVASLGPVAAPSGSRFPLPFAGGSRAASGRQGLDACSRHPYRAA
jgi:hypothetical protein